MPWFSHSCGTHPRQTHIHTHTMARCIATASMLHRDSDKQCRKLVQLTFFIVASQLQVSHFTFAILNRRHIWSNSIACYSCVNWNLILHVRYRDIIVYRTFLSAPVLDGMPWFSQVVWIISAAHTCTPSGTVTWHSFDVAQG